MDIPKRYDEKEAEPRLQKWWDENKTFKFDPKTDKPIFSIDTPPPTVSGKMHMGHAFMYSQMDFIARFKRMTGHELFYPFGTDDNGLPTQLLIQKLKKVRAQDLGRTEFTKLCLETLEKELRPKYLEDWKRIAMSCDWDIFYSTIDKHSRKISQWSFIELYKQGDAYHGEGAVMICPKCKTSIAQVETVDEVKSSSLNYIKAKLETGEFLVFATTRPELTPGNVGLSLDENGEYVRVKKGEETWLLSKEAAENFKDEWQLTDISKPFLGKDLVGKKITIPIIDRQQSITHDRQTKTEFGTGFVYYCTYGGVDCIEWMADHPDAESVPIMDFRGVYNENAGKYQGMTSPEARKAILEDLEKLGVLVKKEPIQHAVNTHERCGTEIEYVEAKQWFIKMKDNKEKWLELGEQFKWYPQHMRNRYENWAKGLRWDWNISRQIFFGVPFPVWYCEKCEEPIMAKEDQLPVDPLVDTAPVEKCPKCNHNKMRGESDIINTWATSSLTPQLAINLFEDENLRKKLYPMSLRPQGHDIISFWLFNTVVKAWLHYESIPWQNAMITGWALDPKGKKMSKSKGNVIEPQVMVEKYSADALRFWAASSKLGDDLPFQEKELVAGKKFVNKLWNASKFVWMHLEDFKGDKPETLETLDKWLLSNLNAVLDEATKHFENYDYSKTKLETEKFFWHVFCDNYLEFVKDRLYNKDKYSKQQRQSAQYTLYHGLLTVLKLMAPITPHITEEVYQLYYKEREQIKSIHLQAWPEKLESDDKAKQAGDVFADVVAGVRKFKSQQKVSLKAEVKELVITGENQFQELLKPLEDELKAITLASSISFGEGGDLNTEVFPLKIRVDLA